ncbi:MAG TPA: glycoside hydrolase family 127 protein, partial [Prolixibacteraceae bacterium]|nr:glycoside hydrolase family 127 protein [Prolixibacteraceae bacterium]
NLTGEPFLLELADLIHSQAFDFTTAFLSGDHLSTPGSLHCVNLAQGIKLPLVVYQQHPDEKYPEATQKAFRDLRKNFGQPYGLFGGDEALHSADPTQGSELCSAVEMMFSLETMLSITGNILYADHLEKIAFNALPAQISDDFLGRQYFQQANQVMITRQMRNFDVNHDGTDVCFGLLTGYPCCTSNMHQGWPKFTQNLFYATSDRGAAALVYAPAQVRLKVAGGEEILIREETNYPFEEKITFHFKLPEGSDHLTFPFRLRIPGWCASPSLLVNGEETGVESVAGLVTLHRAWNTGDRVELNLPMEITLSTWHENSRAVERGPLLYALKIEAEKRVVTNTTDPETYGTEYEEYLPLSPWNYGLTESEVKDPSGKLQVLTKAPASYPWTTEDAPVEIRARGIRIPSWQLYNGSAGPLPWSNMYKMELGDLPEEKEITLIPYGCTTLRITEFPVIREW